MLMVYSQPTTGFPLRISLIFCANNLCAAASYCVYRQSCFPVGQSHLSCVTSDTAPTPILLLFMYFLLSCYDRNLSFYMPSWHPDEAAFL